MESQIPAPRGGNGPTAPPLASEATFGQFRQTPLWPLHLEAARGGVTTRDPATQGAKFGPDNPWQELSGEFKRNPDEFVTFLPPVHRFLYGDSQGAPLSGGSGRKPITVMRRSDIAAVRVTLAPGVPPQTLSIAHIDLYFF